MITIYIAAHSFFEPPKLTEYCPIRVGAALAEEDFGWQRDDAGDHISEKNPFFCELTALYWAWKNDKKSDITGLVHYRRYMKDPENGILQGKHIEKILQEYDLILPEKKVISEDTIAGQYEKMHHVEDLQITEAVIAELYPAYLETYRQVMGGTETYICNMMIGKKDLVDAYAEWLFSVLFEVEKRLDISSYDTYNQRVYGLLSERLLTVWVKQNGWKAFELPLICTEEKTETKAYWEQCEALISQGNFKKAYEVLAEAKEKHADVFMPSSDVLQRLGLLWILLNVYDAEMQGGKFISTLWETLDAGRLVVVFSKLENIIEEPEKWSGLVDMLEQNGIGPVAVLTIFRLKEMPKEEQLKVLAMVAEGYAAKGNLEKAGIYANFALNM